MAIDLERFRQSVVIQMDAWLSSLPKETRRMPLVGFKDGSGEPLCPEDIVRHVREGTPDGERFIEQALALSMVSILQRLSR